MTDLFTKGEWDLSDGKLKTAFGKQRTKITYIGRLRSHITKLFQDQINFPYLPKQDPPFDPYTFEEVDKLFENSKKGGKNYRVAFKSLKQRKIRTINPDLAKYRERFGCNDITQEHLLLARKALLWRELPNDVLDYNLSIFFGRMKFNAQLSHFTAFSRHCQK